MIITMPTGERVAIRAALIVRIRHAVAGDGEVKNAATRIDWADKEFCIESPEDVARMANEERAQSFAPPLSQLLLPDQRPFWFSGKDAVGPFHLADGFEWGGVHSDIKIGSLDQETGSMPEDVAAVIGAANGTVLPIRGDQSFKATLVKE